MSLKSLTNVCRAWNRAEFIEIRSPKSFNRKDFRVKKSLIKSEKTTNFICLWVQLGSYGLLQVFFIYYDCCEILINLILYSISI